MLSFNCVSGTRENRGRKGSKQIKHGEEYSEGMSIASFLYCNVFLPIMFNAYTFMCLYHQEDDDDIPSLACHFESSGEKTQGNIFWDVVVKCIFNHQLIFHA